MTDDDAYELYREGRLTVPGVPPYAARWLTDNGDGEFNRRKAAVARDLAAVGKRQWMRDVIEATR